MHASALLLARRLASWPLLLLSLAAGAALAQAEPDPPGRVAYVSQQEGSIVFAPQDETEWLELPANQPLTRGDRLWTDRASRAALQVGSGTVYLGGESHLAFYELDDEAVQLSLTQGSLSARVRSLQPRENFEVDTPNLAVRALQPADFRVDVDGARGHTQVTVRGGEVVVFGEQGESLRLAAGQQAAFGGRNLAPVRAFFGGTDAFDQWTAELNRQEDQSVSARFVPREVIGYSQLDPYGDWTQHADYGAVWFPRVTVRDWAPYRYGRWSYIRPWGWTWVDDAPWGFAPFHYGRWAVIAGRWAWVPGHFGPRPVYAPALVVFVGGGSGVSFSLQIGGPGIAWYPLAPREPWIPSYRYSHRYLERVNPRIVVRNVHVHVHRSRPGAITAVRRDDFDRGRPVRERWQAVRPAELAGAQELRELPRPERDRATGRAGGAERGDRVPRLQAQPPAPVPLAPGRVVREREEPREPRPRAVQPQQRVQEERQLERQREQAQEQAQREQERVQRERDRQQQEAQRERDRQEREQAVRQQQERQQREQERVQRERDRQQQEAQRERDRQEREQAVRQQQERQQREQERAEREVQREQERVAREQDRARREAASQREQREQAPRPLQERQQREQERAQREAQREQERAQREQRQQRAPQRGDEDRGRGRDRDNRDR